MRSQTPIIADKELFRLWYEFYRLALNSTDDAVRKALSKSKSFYSDWGSDASMHFDDWWRTHRSLFHDEVRLQVASAEQMNSTDYLYIQVPRSKSYGELVEDFKLVLSRELPKSTRRRKLPPPHRFAPTEIQGVKRDSLRMMLDLQKHVFSMPDLKGKALTERVINFFASERFKKKQNEVPTAFRLSLGTLEHTDEADRNIRRYRQKAKRILLNVAKGQFPGRY